MVLMVWAPLSATRVACGLGNASEHWAPPVTVIGLWQVCKPTEANPRPGDWILGLSV